MKQSIRLTIIVAACLLLLSLQGSIARAQTAKVGVLTCKVAGGFGYIVGSRRVIRCTYSSRPGSSEDYEGTLSIIGLDLGYLASATLVWAVFAPTTDMGIGALAGNYAGAGARATAGLGVGVNVMTGFGNSIMLQPVSVEGSSGLYVGLGVAGMTLKPNLQDYY